MNIDVTLKIESPEIMASILALAEALTQMKVDIKHLWEENRIERKTLSRIDVGDKTLLKEETNSIIENQNITLNDIENENNISTMANIEAGTSERSTSEEVKEQRIEGENSQEVKHIEQISKETVIEHIEESDRNQDIEYKEKMSEGQLISEGIEGGNKVIPLQEVRVKLACICQQGKQLQVKRLLEKYGVSKVTELKVQHYESLLKEAESL